MPSGIPRLPGVVPQVPSIGMKASIHLFFDKATVMAALSDMERLSMMKAGGVIRDRVRRIIKRRGMARLSSKLRERFPGAGITTLMQMGVLGKTWTASGREGRRIIREVQRPKPSPAGAPPFTHTPEEGHFASYLGFRRNIWFFYDEAIHGVVVGPSKKGRMIPYLHEFGGMVKLKTWVFIPQVRTKRGGMKSPITMKLAAGDQPKDLSRWQPLRNFEHQSTVYPARPGMKPAMQFCIANGSISRAFKGKFKSTTGAKGSGFTVRRG
jgi:hypothetical protein